MLVFTQYTDTMDYLRERLQAGVRHARSPATPGVGANSGTASTWMPAPRRASRPAFRDGEIKILLCTESASEGLNLQTCGVLINYDMPWNPMRVEQRIGRIDRIGQTTTACGFATTSTGTPSRTASTRR